jgi:hypothetical protein
LVLRGFSFQPIGDKMHDPDQNITVPITSGAFIVTEDDADRKAENVFNRIVRRCKIGRVRFKPRPASRGLIGLLDRYTPPPHPWPLMNGALPDHAYRATAGIMADKVDP